MKIEELPTPALLLDLDVLESNLRTMQDRAGDLGVRLRPHAKTHKCAEVARLQLRFGAKGLTVATLAEARAFLDAAVTDLTWAFPIVPGRIGEAAGLDARARRLEAEGRLRVTVDDGAALDALEGHGHPFHVWLEIDSGYGRTGVDPDSESLVALAERLAGSSLLVFEGLLTHGGQAYEVPGREALRAAAEEERSVTVAAAERLRATGVEVPAVSVGSTPGASAAERMDGVDEIRPGNYAFHDLTQVELGSCEVGDCALTVAATVVSSPPGADRCVLDAGALALSKDPGPGPGRRSRPDSAPEPDVPCMGRLFEDHTAYREGRLSERVRLVSLSQEHGKTEGRLPWGSRVRVLPNHSCLVTPLFDEFAVVRDEKVVDHWPIRRER